MSNQKKKSSTGMPIAIIAVVLILAVAGFAWLYNNNSSKTSVKQPGGTTSSPGANRTPAPQGTIAANAPVGAPLGINVMGAPNAAVTIEEFADFQCGSCAATHPVMKELQAAYAGNRNFRFIFRHYPLPMHDKAFEASLAVEAAGMQGKFWPMQDQLMTNQQAWASNPNYKQLWAEYAQKIGLDVPKFQEDISSIGASSRVNADRTRGQAIGVSSTPSVYLNGRLLPFPDVNVPSLRKMIDAEIQAASAKASTPATNAPAPASNANAAK